MLPFTIGTRAFTAATGAVEVPRGDAFACSLAAGGHWYGHGFSHVQPYPLETGTVVNDRFAVNNIQCPAWMCSAGAVFFADTTETLTVRLNAGGDGQLRVSCPAASFTLRTFSGADLPAAHAAFLHHLGWPNPPPPPERFGDSIFCTWTQYPRCLSRERILTFAHAIRARGYPCSVLTIDDRWESCFGDLEFSPDLPDPRGLVEELHRLGFQVWLWVTPFVNEESAAFAALAGTDALVRARTGAGPARLTWWGGTAGLVDLTGAAGQAWFRGRLARLRSDYGVDGFKLDGGDFKYQPPPDAAAWQLPPGPSGYADRLLELAAELVPNACETRTAWLSQRRAVLWREGGKDSHWGLDNGLKAVVTLALQSSLLGYDILIPDMVPGRVQTLVADFPLPSDELMVRWTEVSALFPVLQFSYAPWNYAPGTEAAVLGYARLHHALGPYLAEQAAARTGPLLRPLWYDSPAEAELYTVADAFLLGRDLLAAPVLDPGVTHRDVRLPRGDWVDAWSGQNLSGGGWLRGHPAPCPGMPLFVRAHRRDLLARVQACLTALRPGSVPAGVTSTTYRAGLNRDLNVTG